MDRSYVLLRFFFVSILEVTVAVTAAPRLLRVAVTAAVAAAVIASNCIGVIVLIKKITNQRICNHLKEPERISL